MNYNTKPNQSTIIRVKVVDKDIRVIVVDVKKRTVSEQKVRNSLHFLRRNFDFFEFVEIQYSPNEMDCFIFGADKDLKVNKPYYYKGYPHPIYGNGILIKYPHNGDYERLKRTKISVSPSKPHLIPSAPLLLTVITGSGFCLCKISCGFFKSPCAKAKLLKPKKVNVKSIFK